MGWKGEKLSSNGREKEGKLEHNGLSKLVRGMFFWRAKGRLGISVAWVKWFVRAEEVEGGVALSL